VHWLQAKPAYPQLHIWLLLLLLLLLLLHTDAAGRAGLTEISKSGAGDTNEEFPPPSLLVARDNTKEMPGQAASCKHFVGWGSSSSWIWPSVKSTKYPGTTPRLLPEHSVPWNGQE
jgi:hypothetical protein